MGAVYTRRGTRFLWMKWTDARGVERRESAGTADPVLARKLLAEVERQEQPVRLVAPPPAIVGPTVEEFLEEVWLPQRRVLRPFAWKNDYSRLKHHFLPKFGNRVLADLASDQGEVDLLDWLLALRTHLSQRDDKPIGSRTIWSLASIVRVFFADALERKHVRRDPTAGWRADRHLPAKEDKEKGWRQRSGFTLDQVVTLSTDARIPEDRRVHYALRFLGGGLRPGEAANARWRDLDRAVEPLWRLVLSSSFSTHALKEKATKTGAELNVPVHPVLQRALAAWWSEGWARFMKRAPTLEDLIVPRLEGGQRRVTTTLLQFHADLAALGLPKQRQYESRSTFRNLALRADASEFHVNLITHPKPQKAADFYTRLEMQWEGMCRAVLAIDPAAWAGKSVVEGAVEQANVPERVVTVRGHSRTVGVPSPTKNPMKNPASGTTETGHCVTPTGLEPMFST